MKNNNIKILGIILFFIIIFFIIIKNIYNNKLLEKHSKYTIGNIISIEPNGNAGYKIYFTYEVNNKIYKAFGGIYRNDKNLIGKRYYIKFSPSNPKICKILLEKEVPGNITNAPPEGWDKIPQ